MNAKKLVWAMVLFFAATALAASPNHFVDGNQVSDGQQVQSQHSSFEYKIIFYNDEMTGFGYGKGHSNSQENPMVCTFVVTPDQIGNHTARVQINDHLVEGPTASFSVSSAPIPPAPPTGPSSGQIYGGTYNGNQTLPAPNPTTTPDSTATPIPPAASSGGTENARAQNNQGAGENNFTPGATENPGNPLSPTTSLFGLSNNQSIGAGLLIIGIGIAFFAWRMK